MKTKPNRTRAITMIDLLATVFLLFIVALFITMFVKSGTVIKKVTATEQSLKENHFIQYGNRFYLPLNIRGTKGYHYDIILSAISEFEKTNSIKVVKFDVWNHTRDDWNGVTHDAHIVHGILIEEWLPQKIVLER